MLDGDGVDVAAGRCSTRARRLASPPMRPRHLPALAVALAPAPPHAGAQPPTPPRPGARVASAAVDGGHVKPAAPAAPAAPAGPTFGATLFANYQYHDDAA